MRLHKFHIAPHEAYDGLTWLVRLDAAVIAVCISLFEAERLVAALTR